jgi:hypothetical protein
MSFGTVRSTSSSADVSRRGRRSSIAGTRSFFESLETRRLLSYTIPSGHEAAYLQRLPAGDPGQIIVRLDSPTGSIGHTFTATSGQHVINAGENEEFLFVDQVPAVWKPTAFGGDPRGIKVLSDAGDATLKIDASAFDDDRSFAVTQSSSTNTTIQVFEIDTLTTGNTHMGEGDLLPKF